MGSEIKRWARKMNGEVGLDLEEWRASQSLTYEQLAGTLECSTSQARRYAVGEMNMEDETLMRALKASNGRIGLYALYQRRLAWLRGRGLWKCQRLEPAQSCCT